MKPLKIGSLPLPKLYICEDKAEADECRDRGIPYIIRPKGFNDDLIIKSVLWRTLTKKFPHIKWTELFGFDYRPPVDVWVPSDYREGDGAKGGSSDSMEKSDDYRETGGGNDGDPLPYERVAIDEYIGDLGYHVDIEELQALKVLPTFLDDIATAIKRNIASTAWMDGYNKKLECNLGSFQGADDAPNLIILDTSGSIPSGVASTMVTLIDTLRHQANADLIITSFTSRFYKSDEELPDQGELKWLIGGCNECVEFYKILREKVLGKHWGNVIIFGDNDAPEDPRFRKYEYSWIKPADLQATRIDRVMAFHTWDDAIPGYGLWAQAAAPKATVVHNHEWVRSMR